MADPWILVQKKKYKEALREYSRLHKAEPTSKFYLGSRAVVYMLLENYAAALDDFLHLFQIDDPRYRSTHEHFFAGICLWHLNRPKEAVTGWEGALTAPYRDAAGGVTAPALLLYAAERLDDPKLRKIALRHLQKHWKKHLRRQARAKAKVTHDDFVHPGLPAWPGAIVPFLLGEITETQFLQRVQNTTSDILRARWVCQADFYLGLRALCNGDRSKFQMGMRQCAASKYGLLEHEYYLARWEIARCFPEPAFP